MILLTVFSIITTHATQSGSPQRLLTARIQNHYTDKREVLVKQTLLFLKALNCDVIKEGVSTAGNKWWSDLMFKNNTENQCKSYLIWLSQPRSKAQDHQLHNLSVQHYPWYFGYFTEEFLKYFSLFSSEISERPKSPHGRSTNFFFPINYSISK